MPKQSNLDRPALHVAFFNRSYYPDTSATGQLLTELCESLVSEYGCRISVVAGVPLLPTTDSPQSRSLISREKHAGVEVLRARGTRFSKVRFAGRFSNYVTYFLSACWAGLHLDQPSVVVCLTDPPIIGLAGYLASRRFGCPLVMAYKDIFPEAARLLEDFDSPFVEAVLERVNRFLAKGADRVAVLGSTMQKRLLEKGASPSRTVIIPDWTDCRQVRPAPKDNPFSRQHGLVDKFVVMHSGNIGLSQGLEVMIEAAAHLKDVPDIQFVLVGEGVKKASLQARVRELGLENVRFLPFQPKSELIHSFASADVFLVSLKERLAGYIVPSKLYGILAAGRPYVASVDKESEVTEITQIHDCGLLTSLGKGEDVAEKILWMYENPDQCKLMGENARRAGLLFDRPVQIKAYYDLFHRLAEERREEIHTPSAKRLFDILLSAAGLLVSSPLWLVISLSLKLDDGGPVFYGQERVGRGERIFKSWKFRSMVPESDRDFGPLAASQGDPRVTRVGRLLRATAMDELPQLWNILKGDMSFVGPRALMPEEISPASPETPAQLLSEVSGYRERHRVTPGLTGIAQIYRSRDVPARLKFRLDRLYIRKRSFWLDLRLIAISFWITCRGTWEEPGDKLRSSGKRN